VLYLPSRYVEAAGRGDMALPEFSCTPDEESVRVRAESAYPDPFAVIPPYLAGSAGGGGGAGAGAGSGSGSGAAASGGGGGAGAASDAAAGRDKKAPLTVRFLVTPPCAKPAAAKPGAPSSSAAAASASAALTILFPVPYNIHPLPYKPEGWSKLSCLPLSRHFIVLWLSCPADQPWVWDAKHDKPDYFGNKWNGD
jgi:hypothetical protein